ncbi:hypothetical protein [Gordonia sp. KTR9]|uniref:hypothetical protein n=1 Tax=Gordonia sp. KTR9 TaxID=337191 RepID=UPI00031F6122|nr:hypothetical protein [Gordonia sp. KTR9]
MNQVVDLDDIVAIATITACVIGRPLSPGESSRLKTAWNQDTPRTLAALADQLDAQLGAADAAQNQPL